MLTNVRDMTPPQLRFAVGMLLKEDIEDPRFMEWVVRGREVGYHLEDPTCNEFSAARLTDKFKVPLNISSYLKDDVEGILFSVSGPTGGVYGNLDGGSEIPLCITRVLIHNTLGEYVDLPDHISE